MRLFLAEIPGSSVPGSLNLLEPLDPWDGGVVKINENESKGAVGSLSIGELAQSLDPRSLDGGVVKMNENESKGAIAPQKWTSE